MSLIDGSQCPNNELLALENQSRKAAAEEFVTSLKKSFSSSAGASVPGSDFSRGPRTLQSPVADFGRRLPYLLDNIGEIACQFRYRLNVLIP